MFIILVLLLVMGIIWKELMPGMRIQGQAGAGPKRVPGQIELC
jgi:hypothetical protein